MTNLAAGIGDPYFYEWSVGLMHALDMLDTHNGIESITLQASNLQGLDDVVINYITGKKRCIQVKHTRTTNNITFSDLVGSGGLLKDIANEWADITSKNIDCIAQLFTNRSSGDNDYKMNLPSGTSYIRPAIVNFWPHIHTQLHSIARLGDIQVPPEWEKAWTEWVEQFNEIKTEDLKLQFLKSLELLFDQPDLANLESIILHKIQVSFGISEPKARTIFHSLDHQLRIWATTRRGNNENITAEMIYTAISIPTQEMMGNHELPPPSPFFSSRQTFAQDLGNKLLKRETPIIFLQGYPGSGKTSLLSYLINRTDPIVDLRFFAFKPISPESTSLSKDSGYTVTPEALWGDLLIQLRNIFNGSLAKYNIPIRNDFITADGLREHVLRLSQGLAEQRGRPTVIAIDGIDHAARAGLSDGLSFLQTLVSPEYVPPGVVFLIAGQNATAYPGYPLWLRTTREDVCSMIIPSIEQDDIRTLLLSMSTVIPHDQYDSVIRLILETCEGNTLSAVFAIHEANYCKDVIELRSRLETRRLKDGITEYYNEIWNASVAPFLPRYPFISYKLAGVFSLSSERISNITLNGIFEELGISSYEWQQILRGLKPLVIDEQGSYRVTHNDVRVHLTMYYNGNPEEVADVANQMAKYYLNNRESVIPRHMDLLKLLNLANRKHEFAYIFTSEYVMEALSIQRPLYEIIDQCRHAVRAAVETKDWDCLQELSCTLITVKQLKASISWLGEEGDIYGQLNRIPVVLITEGRVVRKDAWTVGLLTNVVNDILELIEIEQVDRAEALFHRWIKDIDPIRLSTMLPKEEVFESIHSWKTPEQDSPKEFSSDFISITKKIGRIAQYLEVIWEKRDLASKNDNVIKCEFADGYLKEAILLNNIRAWHQSLYEVDIVYYRTLEDCMFILANEERWVELGLSLKRTANEREKFTKSFQIRAAVWSLRFENRKLFNTWLEPLLKERGSYEFLEIEEYPYEDKLSNYLYYAFFLGWTGNGQEIELIVSSGAESYYRKGGDKRAKDYFCSLLYAVSWLGRWFQNSKTKTMVEVQKIYTLDDFSYVCEIVLKPSYASVFLNSSVYEMRRLILNTIIIETNEIKGEYQNKLYSLIKEHILKSFPIDLTLELCWDFIWKRGDAELLKTWFIKCVGEDGIVWSEEIAIRNETVDRFANVLKEIGWVELAEQIIEKKRWALIGYTGHKEYALETPVMWFGSLMRYEPACWKDEGFRLLALSKEATRVGDNRLSIFINATVSTAAANCGPGEFAKFLSAINSTTNELWISQDNKIIFDGLIGTLETSVFSEDELIAMWSFAVSTLNRFDGFDQCYLADIKDVIEIAADRLRITEISDKLKAISTASYNSVFSESRYRIPARWFKPSFLLNDEEKEVLTIVESLGIPEAFDIFGKELTLQQIKPWRVMSILLRRLSTKRPAGFQDYINQCIQMVQIRDYSYGWSYDGIDIVYKELIPFMTSDQQWDVLMDIIKRNNIDESSESWLSAISENMNLLCLFRDQRSELGKGTRHLIETHELWIEAHGMLPAIDRPILSDEIEQSVFVGSWLEIFKK
jgi:hypothetical protein